MLSCKIYIYARLHSIVVYAFVLVHTYTGRGKLQNTMSIVVSDSVTFWLSARLSLPLIVIHHKLGLLRLTMWS